MLALPLWVMSGICGCRVRCRQIGVTRGWQGNGRKAAGGQLLEQSAQHRQHQRCTGNSMCGRAVMQQEDITCSQSEYQPLQYLRWIAAHGIESPSGPGNVAQAMPCQHRIEERAAESGRCAKKSGRPAGDAGDDRLCATDLAAEPEKSVQRERM